jgi:hypothetical protein
MSLNMNDPAGITVGDRRQINSASDGRFSRLRSGVFTRPEVITRDASPRVLFASPAAEDLVEDAQNEGCNI